MLLAWAIAWIAVGLRVGQEVRALSDLSRTLSQMGVAVEESGRALRRLSIPVVGGEVRRIAIRIERIGADAQSGARSSASGVSRLGTALGVLLAVVPNLPLLLVYVPARLALRAEAMAVEELLRQGRGDSEVERLLAVRAVQNLPYRQLLEISRHPLRDVQEGRCRELAAAELRRLGVSRPV